jgi:hypothetical protein
MLASFIETSKILINLTKNNQSKEYQIVAHHNAITIPVYHCSILEPKRPCTQNCRLGREYGLTLQFAGRVGAER